MYIVQIQENGERNEESERGRRKALVRRDGVGYPSVHRLELCVTSRAAQSADNDNKMR